MDDELFKKYLDPQSQYHPVAFANPLEMLNIVYKNAQAIFTNPWDWQRTTLDILLHTKCNNKEPLRLIVSANNGAGKDSMINAPLAIFQALCKIRSRTVITTASYTQLTLQTEAYIRSIANQVNNFFESQNIYNEKVFLIKKEHIVCTLTGSEIILFVTDEGGRAEGYHPFPDYPDGEVTIILNEAKTVPDLIFEHLSRCTYCRWLEISSPGGMSGKHYKHYCNSIEYPATYRTDKFYLRRVTSRDCPHISVEKIESDKVEYGESSAIFRSKHLALFTSLNEQIVITKESIEQALLFPHDKIPLGIGLGAGLDIAGGGDENVLIVRDDNEIIGTEYFRAADTAAVTIPILCDFFKKYNLQGDQIYADDGGIGQAVIDGLRLRGYEVNRILNQSVASQKGQYGNRGAELWFRFSQFAQYIRYPKNDDKLISQLTSRYYTHQELSGRLILESKKMARSKGHGSPDRADALILAYTGVTIHTFTNKLGLTLAASSIKRKLIGAAEAAEKYSTTKNKYQTPLVSMESALAMARVEELTSSNKKGIKITNPGKLLRSLY